MPDYSQAYMSTLLDVIDFMSQKARPLFMASDALASRMGQFHNMQRRFAMLRKRKVHRRLTRSGLAVVFLLSAVVLPVGARLARGDDQPAVQGTPPNLPRANNDSNGPPDRTRETTHETPSLLLDAEQQNLDWNKSRQSQDEVARLESELNAAVKNVDRIRRELDRVKSKSTSQTNANLNTGVVWTNLDSQDASLGHIVFRYQDDGSDGTVQAFDRRSKKLMWTLKMQLNADSVISCYDNATLIIKSADGYTRLVKAEGGQVTRVWAPGVEAPPAPTDLAVNPFGNSVAHPSAEKAISPGTPPQDQEKRLKQVEESIRALTDAVDRLERAQKERQN
jgi:hypothetical protein